MLIFMENKEKVSLSFPDIFNDIFDCFTQGRIVFDILLHLLDGVNDGRVMTVAEFLTDVLHREGRQFTHDIDRDLSRLIDICTAGFL